MDKAITGNGEYKPVAMDAEHRYDSKAACLYGIMLRFFLVRSNIFCLGFDSGSSRLYSGGNDEQVKACWSWRGI